MSPIPVAFYAPLKSPDDPTPSGDRTMARSFLAALETAGFRPHVASPLRMRVASGGEMAKRLAVAALEADRLIATYRAAPERPRLWLTYHCFYKAPDAIGPAVAAALDIPYLVAEGSRAPKRAVGAWADGHRAAEAALDAAATVFVVNPADRAMLEQHRPPGQRLVDLPPFLDIAAWPTAPLRRPNGPARLLAVAMMRSGDKLRSYGLLAEALRQTARDDWTLDIVGDGPARAEVEALFASFGDRVRLHGLVGDRSALAAFYAQADLLVWPACNEALGMIFLEAATQNCPSLAGRIGGVPALVRHGETGWLVEGDDPAAFAAGLQLVLADPALRIRLGIAAGRNVRTTHSLTGAAEILTREACRLLTPPEARRA